MLAARTGRLSPEVAPWLATPALCVNFTADDLDAVVVPPACAVQPDAVAWATLPTGVGHSGFPPHGRGFAAAIVRVDRTRARTRHWIGQVLTRLAPGGWLVVDGQKTDGIDSLWKECRGWLGDADTLTRAHGRLFWGRPGAEVPDWHCLAEDWPGVEGFRTAPGIFSADGIDPASRALADALPSDLSGAVADLGAGWGYLSRSVLDRPGVTSVHLIEADHDALAAARCNIGDPRAQFVWGDATRWRPDGKLDAVVTNPPFHRGRAGDPGLGKAFIRSAAAILAPRGRLWLVANRHLPYEAELDAAFAEVTEVPGPPAFKLFRAARPRRA